MGTVIEPGTSVPAYRLSAGIEMLFTEGNRPFEERVRLASEAGFDAVEIWDWRTKDLDAFAQALTTYGVDLITMCATPQLPLTDPGNHEAFLAGVRDSLPVAERLGCRFLVCYPGLSTGAPDAEQRAAVVAVLRAAGQSLEGSQVALLVENLNTRVDHPGMWIDSTPTTLDVVDEVAHPHVRMLYDRYHAIVMGESIDDLAGRVDRVGHVQLADAPGRGAPGSAEVDWAAEIEALAAVGYCGALGLECRPTGGSAHSADLLREVIAAASSWAGEPVR